MDTLGDRIRLLRKERDLSQNDLGRILGVSRSAISSYENNSRKPDQDSLINIANCFQVSVDYLLGFETQDFDSSELKSVFQEISTLLHSSSIESVKKGEILNEVRDYFRWKLDQAHQNHVKL